VGKEKLTKELPAEVLFPQRREVGSLKENGHRIGNMGQRSRSCSFVKTTTMSDTFEWGTAGEYLFYEAKRWSEMK